MNKNKQLISQKQKNINNSLKRINKNLKSAYKQLLSTDNYDKKLRAKISAYIAQLKKLSSRVNASFENIDGSQVDKALQYWTQLWESKKIKPANLCSYRQE